MTVFLTGGSGFLGSHIASQLSQAGRRVRALVRPSSDTSLLESLDGVELVHCPIDDADGLAHVIKGSTAVIHAAGLVKARHKNDFYRVNAEGSRTMMDAATAAGGIERFVLISSAAVGGPSIDGRAVKPSDEPRPVTYYGQSKRAAEEFALQRKAQLPLTILRPPAIYGPRDREILLFFQALKRGVLPLTSPKGNRLSMIAGSDCAAACIRATEVDLPSGTVLSVSDGSVHTFAELIEEAEKALGRRAWLRLPLPRIVTLCAATLTEAYGALFNTPVIFTRNKCNELFAEWVCDSTLANRLLGWQAQVAFADGIRETAHWYRENGWL